MEYIQQELQSITQFFYLGELESFSKAGGLANENYYVNTGNGKFVIKIIREHSASSVRTELPFFQRLREHNYPASFYLSSPKGECVFESNKLVAVAMHRVEGSAPIITIDTSLCLGRALAALHSIPTKGLKTRSAFLNDTYIPQCIDDLAKAVPQKDLSPYQIEYEKLAEFQSQYKLQKECIIHGDFSPKNCLFQGEELLSVIDWEEVSLGYPVLDLALTIFAVCFNESGFDDKLFVALLDGYQSTRRLSPEEYNHLGDSVRSVGLTFSIWVYLRYGIGNNDPNLIKARRTYWEYNLGSWTTPK